MNWASRIGENTSIVIERNLNARRHEQQSYPTCRAILSLADTSSPYLLEISCEQVLKNIKAVQSQKLSAEELQLLRSLTTANKYEQHRN